MATIKKIRTPAQLRAIARSQVGSEISSQVSPWAIQRNQLKTRRQRALDDMNTLFGGLQGYETKAIGNMTTANQQGADLQNQAFQQAQARLDQFRQQRAAEAQALAQSTGGPVPISAFTDQIDPGGIQQSAASGALISAIGAGQDQTAEQGRFATEVFPLIQTEENKTVRQNYEDSINAVQSEIANIKGQRGGLVNKRYGDLLASERDYQNSQATLGLNQAQLTENKRQFNVGQTEAQREFNQKLAFQKTQVTAAKAAATHAAEATQLINAITSPGQNLQDIKISKDVPVGYMSPFLAQQKGYYTIPGDKRTDPAGRRVYYKHVQGTATRDFGSTGVSPTAINPNTGQPWGDDAYGEVYLRLVGQGVNPNLAKRTVTRYFHLDPSWKAPSTVQQKLATGLPHIGKPTKPGKKKKVNRKNTRKAPG